MIKWIDEFVEESFSGTSLDIYCETNNPWISTDCLAGVPDAEWNVDNVNRALTINYNVLRYVPERLKTQIMCQRAFDAKFDLITHVPKKYITKSMCISILKNGSLSLFTHIPLWLKTADIWFESRTVFVHMLQGLPYSIFTDEFCIRLARHHGDHRLLQYLPRQPPTACEKIIERHPNALEYVWDKTPELCLMAVIMAPETIRFLSKKQQTDELCQLAIDRAPHNLRFVKNQTRKLCASAVKKSALSTVQDKSDSTAVMHMIRVQTRETCLACYEVNRNVFQGIRNDSHRRFVARHVSVDFVLALREAGLSTHLLVNVLEQMESDLYPTLNYNSNSLSPTQLWSIVALANHA
ncbi:MAG: hypothetical protein WC052_04515 [Patescibacteria group bacterium]